MAASDSLTRWTPVARHRDVATIWKAPASKKERDSFIRELVAAAATERACRPLHQVLQIVVEAGCQSIVVEEKYIDLDYRSEYSSFWSKRFENRAATARRLHFFKSSVTLDRLHRTNSEDGYLGYCVLRHSTLGPVGRTVIRPPDRLRAAVLTTVTERPSVFGVSHEVVGVPFCQQDGEFLVCAHTAAWLCHYVAQSRGVIGRRVTADIASIPTAEGSRHRPLPSNGLTGEQLQAVFSSIGIPAPFYDVEDLPALPAPLNNRSRHLPFSGKSDDRERVLRVVCKYLNSGFPVVVLTRGSRGHAFTLVGWIENEHGFALIACDDQIGPYEMILDPISKGAIGHRTPWRSLMVPLPEKVFFTGEAAEIRARNLPNISLARMRERGVPLPEELVNLVDGLQTLGGRISLRTKLVEGREFKELAGRQGRSPAALRAIRLAHLPHWVWVVEMHDRQRRAAGAACVLAEWVFDSTAHDDAPRELVASTLSTTVDAEGLAGRLETTPLLDFIAKGSGKPWRSLITDPMVVSWPYAVPYSDPPTVPTDQTLDQRPQKTTGSAIDLESSRPSAQ